MTGFHQRIFLVTLALLLAAGGWFSSPRLLAQRTSENTPLLKRGLQQYPQADTNHDGVLTEAEAREFLGRRRKAKSPAAPGKYEIAPTHAEVKYGPYPRNVLDLWLAKRADGKPTPLAVFIHGGGFSAGDKSKVSMGTVRQLLGAGISVAAINYRLIDSGPFPLPMLDGARAIQFLRYHADEYHLRKDRVACFGGSAGGCMSMWLAFHDDLADPKNPDPVLRESTRLTCAAPTAGQSSVELKTLLEWFHCDKLQEHPSTRGFFGVDSLEDLEKPQKIALMKEASPITHLTADDPPIYATYGQADTPVDETTPPGVWVHHPRLGIKLKEAMDRQHLECHLQYPGGPPPSAYKNAVEFMIEKLNQ
jgi:acetyl esterase/lipase